VRSRFGVAVPMRDGVRLAADVHLPDAPAGSVPAVLHRTPYGRQSRSPVRTAQALTRAGFACVAQDVRGRFDSEGDWPSYRAEEEGRDGYDAIEWLAAQDWCDGCVGTVGISYSGWVQWAAARQRPPHLRTMVVGAAPGLWLEEIPHCWGASVPLALGWFAYVAGRVVQDVELIDWEAVWSHRPMGQMDAALGRELPHWRDWLARPTLDDGWAAETVRDEELAQVDCPVLHVTGWFDEHRRSTIDYHERLVRSSPSHARRELLIGPWTHDGCRFPERELDAVDHGPQAAPDMDEVYVRWFDRHLRDEPERQPGGAAIRLFVTGSNRWRELPAWPQTSADRWLLASAGDARSTDGDGMLAREHGASAVVDRLRADPLNPVRSAPVATDLGGTSWSSLLDHVQERNDVLVYSSPWLSEEVLAIGPASVELHVSGDAPDFDVIVLLGDAVPSGGTRLLAQTVKRMRGRDSLARESDPVDAGRVYALRFELGAIAHAFRPGHAIRLCVAASWFPFYDCNPQTGERSATATATRVAQIAVHHDRARPSALTLPVLTRA
jgi:uncharacterized protein